MFVIVDLRFVVILKRKTFINFSMIGNVQVYSYRWELKHEISPVPPKKKKKRKKKNLTNRGWGHVDNCYIFTRIAAGRQRHILWYHLRFPTSPTYFQVKRWGEE